MWIFSKVWHRYALLFFLYMADSSNGESSKDVYTKECQGTNTRLSHVGVSSDRYISYRNRYSNCTLVTSNLEIVFLELTDDEYDLSFLEDIREVSGYVLIYGNYLSKIRLSKLRVIRGMTLFQVDQRETPRFSLYVERNSRKGNGTIGLQELQMPSLVEILRGEVYFSENKRLCFGENTINWDYIIGKERVRSINELTGDGYEKVNCQSYGTCHESCAADDGKRYCWGSGSDMCQSIHTCKDCGDERCTQQSANSCCSRQCIVGCNQANDNSQCLSCRKYARNNGESCVEDCSTPVVNVNSNSTEIPEDKYIEGTKCVKQCANNLVLQDGRCSSNCRQNFVESRSNTLRECIPCVGETCIVTCEGTKPWIHKENIQNFLNCVKVNGNLVIQNFSFKGHAMGTKITVEDLEQLSTIEEITGSLSVGASYDGFTSLSFLRNLRKIGADSPGEPRKGLYVTETSLMSLELNSLEAVLGGWILIAHNPQLCFVEEIKWSKMWEKWKFMANKNSSLCSKEGLVCSPTCLEADGCMGPGNESCVSCPHFQSIDRTCVSECLTEGGFYVNEKGIRGNRECRPCHEECNGKCNGDGPTDCVECKNVKHNGACVSACPPQTYRDADAVCQSCSSVCDQCTGNDTVLGKGGCSNCDKSIILFDEETTGRCIVEETECDENYFLNDEPIRVFNDKSRPMKACRRCHPQCNGCTERKSTDCLKCKHYRQNTTEDISECVEQCSEAFYDGGTNQCLPCDPQCLGCSGATVHQCLLCKSVRVYSRPTDLTESFCDAVCPDGLYERKNENNTESECVVPAASTEFMRPKTAIPVFVILFLVIVGVVTIFVLLWRRQKMRQRRANILDLEEIPANSDKVKYIRDIKEKELRRGNVIGSGTFGIVYKGIWIPERERVKIPVAIKVLQDLCGTDQDGKLLKETSDIGSVCHPNCVRILAICFTSQLTLVTQLMPLGCLLVYVRKEKSNIGSRALFLWSIQIAKGMGHLEEIGVVHRNLAARNVLVHTPDQVKVTDFGLGKLFEDEGEEINTEKIPIKWMALESIRKRVYTHKSDVWSFGVTLWEMFSYGETPYENLQNHQVPQALEKGERLPQPGICTIDVYTVLIKCWMLDVNSRPTFPDFVNEFTRMAVDPGRYLVIQGDALMRLPSPAPATNELFRLMSLPSVEPDFKLMSAEEYLDGSDDFNHSNAFFAPQLMSIPEDVTRENSGPNERETEKETDADDKTSRKLSHQTSSDPHERYISDPCRNDAGYGSTDDGGPNGNGPKFQMDADGYLPPQSLGHQSKYLDLVYHNTNLGSPLPEGHDQQRPDMNARIGISRDNLEYFENESALLTDAVVKNKDTRNQDDSEYCNVTSKGARIGISRDNPEYFENESALLTDAVVKNKDKKNQNDSEYCNVTSKGASGSPSYERF